MARGGAVGCIQLMPFCGLIAGSPLIEVFVYLVPSSYGDVQGGLRSRSKEASR